MDLPPQNALLADEPVRLAQCPCDRVVLAREPADDDIDVWDRGERRSPTDRVHFGLELVQDLGDVLVHRLVTRSPRPSGGAAIPRSPRPYLWKSPSRTWRT